VRSWNPPQILALVLGVTFVVLGGVALLRTGLDMNLFEPTVTVGGLAYTPLLGLIELVLGLVLLAVGAFPVEADSFVFLGVLLIAFGLLLVIEPEAFRTSLAAGRAHGWFYVAVGAVSVGVGLGTPAVQRWQARRTRGEPRDPSATRRLED
jgi:hypothetical protein